MQEQQIDAAWDDKLDDEFGLKLSGDKRDRWWATLRNEFYNLTNSEACAAIDAASRLRDGDKFKGKPTLRELRIWIAMERKKNRYGASADSREGVLNFLKAKIREAEPDNMRQWSIICSAETLFPDVVKQIISNEQCAELEDWAVLELDFKRPDWLDISQGRDLAAAAQKAKEAMTRTP